MARWLSVHADYACRHRGACCEAGWAIPVERELVPLWRPDWRARLGPDGALATAGGCPLREEGRCGVHRGLGPEALPAACRDFPCVLRTRLREGEHVTGLIFVAESTRDMHDMMGTTETPLNQVPYEKMHPGSEGLRKILQRYA